MDLSFRFLLNGLFTYTSAEITAIELSLKVALICTVVVLPIAIFIGWFLARKQFHGKSFVEGFLHLPLVLPPVTTGYILLDFVWNKWLAWEFSCTIISEFELLFLFPPQLLQLLSFHFLW